MSKHSGFELVGDITPDADNTRDLGSSAKRFADVYAVNIHSDNVDGVDLSAHVADENAHHDKVHGLGDTAIHTGSLADGQHGDRSAEAGVTHHDVSQITGAVSEATFNSHASRHEHGGADEINVNDLEGLLAGPQKFKAQDTSSGSTYICRNLKASDGAVADCYGDTVTIKAAEGLRNFIVPLYGMTPQFTEEGRNVYDPYRAAFQFRPSFDCKWAGLRLPLRYVGSTPQLNFHLYRWDGSSWVLVDSMAITTSDCGSNASAGYATFVVKLIDLASREKLNADDLYEVRIASSGSSSNYWRLYYDAVSYRDWKGRDCIGLKLSNDSGSTWTCYAGDELSVQVLVSPDV